MSKNKPTTAAGVVLAIFQASSSELATKQVIKLAAGKGIKQASCLKALQTLANDGDIERRGRGSYAKPGVPQKNPAAVADPGPLGTALAAPSLGTICAVSPKERIDSNRQQQLLDLFDDEDNWYTLNQLHDCLPSWERREIAQRLRTGIDAGVLATHLSKRENANIYMLASAGAKVAPAIMQRPATAPFLSDEARVTPALPPASDKDKPDFLRARVDAVCDDLAALVNDACDQQLPHPLIKALAAANGAAQRAARQLPLEH